MKPTVSLVLDLPCVTVVQLRAALMAGVVQATPREPAARHGIHPIKRTVPHLREVTAAVVVWLIFVLTTGLAAAEPYLPTTDDQVLERLPSPLREVELIRLQKELAREPADLSLALRLAQQQVEASRGSGDPRHLGRAEAVLAPWWNDKDPPASVLVMRAIVRQASHAFDAALADLNDAVERDPSNRQAWLTRASIHQVRGDYARSQDDCRQLMDLRQYLVAQICLAEVAGLSGRSEQAYHLLARLAAQTPAAQSGTRLWLEGLLADIAERRGDTHGADRHYRAALSGGTPDMFLLTAYADYLLDQGRPHEVISLLEPYHGADAALLRLALAARDLHHPQRTAYLEELRARFSTRHQRSGNVHLREQARFTLSLLNDPEAALTLAMANWAVQREPADARILLEAALAAGNPGTAAPVLLWLNASGLEDARLESVRQALKG